MAKETETVVEETKVKNPNDKKTPETEAEKRNTSPDNALRYDWPAKHRELSPYITMKGKIRGGISPKDQIKAKQILKKYGFEA